MMEQQARRRQLDLLVLAAGDLARRRFDPATRAEIVNLLKVLLNECAVSAAGRPEMDDD
jgi:hypothetical protein